jgi:hypothetical protein
MAGHRKAGLYIFGSSSRSGRAVSTFPYSGVIPAHPSQIDEIQQSQGLQREPAIHHGNLSHDSPLVSSRLWAPGGSIETRKGSLLLHATWNWRSGLSGVHFEDTVGAAYVTGPASNVSAVTELATLRFRDHMNTNPLFA